MLCFHVDTDKQKTEGSKAKHLGPNPSSERSPNQSGGTIVLEVRSLSGNLRRITQPKRLSFGLAYYQCPSVHSYPVFAFLCLKESLQTLGTKQSMRINDFTENIIFFKAMPTMAWNLLQILGHVYFLAAVQIIKQKTTSSFSWCWIGGRNWEDKCKFR